MAVARPGYWEDLGHDGGPGGGYLSGLPRELSRQFHADLYVTRQARPLLLTQS